MSKKTYYAIGDVHGEARRLARMHALVLEDIAERGGEACVIHLGDLIDRGPDSREAVACALALHEKATSRMSVITLRGNHEQMLLDAADDPSGRQFNHWRRNGGEEALASYQKANGAAHDWRDSIDPEHMAFFRSLKTLAMDEERGLVFVHAGIDPARFPDCDGERRLWTRSPRFFDTTRWPDRPELEGLTVIHGHTPTESKRPFADDRRINVDTGAVYGGALTTAVLAPGESVRFLQT